MSRPKSGSVRKRGERSFQARWINRKGERESLGGFPTYEDALAYAQAAYTDQRRGEDLDRTRARRTFAHYADEWLAMSAYRPKTEEGYRAILRKHLRPAFGDVAVADLDHPAVARLLTDLSRRGYAPNTVKCIYSVARSVFGTARLAGAIRTNPCDDQRLPSVEPADTRALTAEQVAVLTDAMPEPYAVPVLFAAYTGLRAGALWGLRVESVDLLRRTVRVKETVSDLGGDTELVRGPPKSKASRRTISIPSFLAEEVGAHLGRRYSSSPPADAPVFPDEYGNTVRHSRFSGRVWRPTLDALPEEFAGLRFHDLRHTCASLLINEGADALAVARRLGHSNVSLTLNTYAHLFDSRDAALSDALDAAYDRAR